MAGNVRGSLSVGLIHAWELEISSSKGLRISMSTPSFEKDIDISPCALLDPTLKIFG
jgi:hypothetical protein